MALQSNKLDLSKIDVVYPVKITREGNAELRYSLRSLVNLPHKDVHIFSDYIPWLSKNVKWHPSSDRPGVPRFANVNTSLLRACKDQNISDPFVFMNDDFFILNSIDEIPYYYNGTLQQHYDFLHKTYTSGSKYMRHLLEAQTVLKNGGFDNLDYELHCPILFKKKELQQILEQFPDTACRRTLYANMLKIKGEQAIDFKIYGFLDNFDHSRSFVSTTDANFKRQSGVRSLIRSRFTKPSEYEK